MPTEAILKQFYSSSARASDAEGIFRALEKSADTLVGVKLFTLTTFDDQSGLARRCYSNRPDAYPCSGLKKVDSDGWTRQVLIDQQNFVANDLDAIAQVFSDHELIASLGCHSVMNLPVVSAGVVLGTINCLHQNGHYTPDLVSRAEALKLPGLVCFLMEKLDTEKGDR